MWRKTSPQSYQSTMLTTIYSYYYYYYKEIRIKITVYHQRLANIFDMTDDSKHVCFFGNPLDYRDFAQKELMKLTHGQLLDFSIRSHLQEREREKLSHE